MRMPNRSRVIRNQVIAVLIPLIGFFVLPFSPVIGQETLEASLKLDDPYFRLIEIDGKEVDLEAGKFAVLGGNHTAVIQFKAPYRSADDRSVNGQSEQLKILEFSVETGKAYKVKGLTLNYSDTLKRRIVFNDRRFVEVVENKSKLRTGGTCDTGLVFFEIKKDSLCSDIVSGRKVGGEELISIVPYPSYCTHLYAGPKLSGAKLTGILVNFPGVTEFALTGRTDEGYDVVYNYIKEDIEKIFFVKPGIYNLFYDTRTATKTAKYTMSIRAKANQFYAISKTGGVTCSDPEFLLLGSTVLNDVFFLPDGLHGWIVGEDGIILKTSDGGDRWDYGNIKTYLKGDFLKRMTTSMQRTNRSNSFNVIHFTDSLNGWIGGGNGLVLHTTDGGETWSSQSIPSKKDIRDLRFSGEKVGVITAWDMNGGAISATRDSGKTWDYLYKDNIHAYEYFAMDTSNIWRSTRHGLAHSTDQGQTWNNWGLWGNLHILNVNALWVVGQDSIYFTPDLGESWEKRALPPGTAKRIDFSDPDHGCAFGAEGTIHRTDDRGATWRLIQANTLETIIDAQFIGEKGWAVGNNGGILRTRDGGIHWEYQNVLDLVKKEF